MFAKNRCRVASFSLRCLSKRFCKKKKHTEQMHPEVGVYLQMKDWNDDDAHPNYVEMSTRRTLRFILQVLNYVCIYMVSLYLTSFSSIQTQGRCPPFFPFHMVLTGGSWPGAPHHRCHPETPGGGPATRSCSKGSAVWCKSSVHADLHVQTGAAPAAAGEAG